MEENSVFLASTSRFLEQLLALIRTYSCRFRIEYTFSELKQQTVAFCCHYFSKHMPKLSCYQKKGEPAPIAQVESGKVRKKIMEMVCAVAMHMILSCIAMETLQLLTFQLTSRITSS